MTFLIGNNIYLRAPEPSDTDCMFRWENDSRIWHYGINRTPLSRQLIHDYISNYDGDIQHTRQLRLIIVRKEDDTPIGTLDLTGYDTINQRAETGIFIDSSYRRRGYASEALTLLDEYASECLGLHQLWCIVPVDNIPSGQLFKKAGYKSSGCLKSWIRFGHKYFDAYLLQKLFQ